MKFMYEYCTRFFDTRHLVIAVNPRHIEMYESLLFFRRLQEQVVANYDFVNGAPAVGATLDLKAAPGSFARAYGGASASRGICITTSRRSRCRTSTFPSGPTTPRTTR